MDTEQTDQPAEVMADREDTPAMEAGYNPVDAAMAQGFDANDIAAAMFDYGPAPTSDVDIRLAALERQMAMLTGGASLFPALASLSGIGSEDGDYMPEDGDLPDPHALVAEFRSLQARFNTLARGLGYDHLMKE